MSGGIVVREDQNALLTVTDNGAGIYSDDLPRIIGRFYRADRSRSSADGHPGLGVHCSAAIAGGYCREKLVKLPWPSIRPGFSFEWTLK